MNDDNIIKMVVGDRATCDFLPLDSITERTDSEVDAMDLNRIVLFPGSLTELYAKDSSTQYRIGCVGSGPVKITFRLDAKQLSDMQSYQDERFEREFKRQIALSGFDGLVRFAQTKTVSPFRVRTIDWDLMAEVDSGPGIVLGAEDMVLRDPTLADYRRIEGVPIIRIKDGGTK